MGTWRHTQIEPFSVKKVLTRAQAPQKRTSRRAAGHSRPASASAMNENSVAAAPSWKLIPPCAASTGPGLLMPKPQAGLKSWWKKTKCWAGS